MDITLSQNLVREFHEKLKSDKEKETISFSTLVLQVISICIRNCNKNGEFSPSHFS